MHWRQWWTRREVQGGTMRKLGRNEQVERRERKWRGGETQGGVKKVREERGGKKRSLLLAPPFWA